MGCSNGARVSRTCGAPLVSGVSTGWKRFSRVTALFDPKRAVAQGVDVLTQHGYQDLNAHPDLVLRAGFIERDGRVVLYARPPGPAAAAPPREPADRAAHAGDERFVFPGKAR